MKYYSYLFFTIIYFHFKLPNCDRAEVVISDEKLRIDDATALEAADDDAINIKIRLNKYK